MGNRDAFTQRYPLAGPIAGVLNGKLNNDSGRLACLAQLREPVSRFSSTFRTGSCQPMGRAIPVVLREEAAGSLCPPVTPQVGGPAAHVGGSPVSPIRHPVFLRATLEEGILKIRLAGQAGRSTLQGGSHSRWDPGRRASTPDGLRRWRRGVQRHPQFQHPLFQILLP